MISIPPILTNFAIYPRWSTANGIPAKPTNRLKVSRWSSWRFGSNLDCLFIRYSIGNTTGAFYIPNVDAAGIGFLNIRQRLHLKTHSA